MYSGFSLYSVANNSKQFGQFSKFFISKEKWATMREQFFARAGLPMDGEKSKDYLGPAQRPESPIGEVSALYSRELDVP